MVASEHKLIYESINFPPLKPRANGHNIVSQYLATLLGVVASVCTYLKSLTGFKLCSTTPNNMQQGVQTDATCNIQQCWELLVNNVASVCT